MARYFDSGKQQWRFRNAFSDRPEDASRCIEEVYGSGLADIGSNHQCFRKRGHGPDGAYCKQHGKLAEAAIQRLLHDDDIPAW